MLIESLQTEGNDIVRNLDLHQESKSVIEGISEGKVKSFIRSIQY